MTRLPEPPHDTDAIAPGPSDGDVDEPEGPYERVRRLGAANRGVVLRSAAVDAGIPASTQARLVAARAWQAPHPHVLVLPGAANDARTRVAAALASIGGDVAVTGFTLLWLVGLLPAPPTIVDVAVAYPRDVRERVDVRVHRLRTLSDRLTEAGGFRATTVAVALLLVARTADIEWLRTLVIDARQRRLVTIPELLALCAVARTAPGVAKLRRVAKELDGDGSESALDLLVRSKLAETDLPPPEPEPVEVRGDDGVLRHPDIGWLLLKTAIDCYGLAAHLGSAKQISDDTRRANGLALSDWLCFTVTWHLAVHDWTSVVGHLRIGMQRQATRFGLPWPLPQDLGRRP